MGRKYTTGYNKMRKSEMTKEEYVQVLSEIKEAGAIIDKVHSLLKKRTPEDIDTLTKLGKCNSHYSGSYLASVIQTFNTRIERF